MKDMKRKQDESDCAGEYKKQKQDLDTADTISLLKQRLNEEENEIAGLKEFVKRFTGENGHTFVETFLKTSPECKEIFNLFGIDGRPPPEKLALIWELFEAILMVLSEKEDNTFKSIGVFLVSKILQNHLKLMYSSLNSNASNQLCKSMLKCMAVMLAQGLASVKEFLASFDFSLKDLKLIAKKRDRKQKPDIRTCFIRFCLAFFVFGDVSVISKFLEEKGLATLILHDIQYDSADTILVVLEMLKDKVVNEVKLLKKTKLLFFNPQIMSRLSNLCKNPNEAVQTTTKEILSRLCTDVKCGICFISTEEKTHDKLLNPVLLKFLLQVKTQAMQQDYLFNLTTETLLTCRDLIFPYFNGLKLQLEPRNSEAWFQSITFLIKLFTSVAVDKSQVRNDQQLCKFMFLDVMTRSQIMAGLKNSSKKVQLQTLRLLQLSLSRCVDLIHTVRRDSTVLSKDDFVDDIVRKLPDVSAVIAIRQNMSLKSPGEKECEAGEEGEENLLKTDELKEDAPSNLLLLKAGTICLYLYQCLKPGVLTESGFNICKLLTATGVKVSEDVLVHSLDILLSEPTVTRSWLEKKISGFGNIIQLILNVMFEWKHNVEILKKSKLLFFKVLNTSGQFHCFQFEVDAWLNTLLYFLRENSESDSNKQIFHEFSESCMKVVHEPFVFIQDILMETRKLHVSLPETSVALLYHMAKDLGALVVASITRQAECLVAEIWEAVPCNLLLLVKDAIKQIITPVLKAQLVSLPNPQVLLKVVSKHVAEETSEYYNEFWRFASKWLQTLGKESFLLDEHNICDGSDPSVAVLDEFCSSLFTLVQCESACLKNLTELLSRVELTKYFSSTGQAWFLFNVIFILHKRFQKEEQSQLLVELQEVLCNCLSNILSQTDGQEKMIFRIVTGLPLFKEFEKLNDVLWEPFVEHVFKVFLRCKPNLQSESIFSVFFEAFVSKLFCCGADQIKRMFQFLHDLKDCLFVENLSYIVKKIVQSVFNTVMDDELVKIFNNAVKSLFAKVANIWAISNVDFGIDVSAYLQETVTHKRTPQLQFLHTLFTVLNPKVHVSSDTFTNLLLEHDECFRLTAVLLCQRDFKLLKVYMNLSLDNNSTMQVFGDMLPLTLAALKNCNEDVQMYDTFCKHLLESWNVLLTACLSRKDSASSSHEILRLLTPYASEKNKCHALKNLLQTIEKDASITDGSLMVLFISSKCILTSLTEETSVVTLGVKLLNALINQWIEIAGESQKKFGFIQDIASIMKSKSIKSKYLSDCVNSWNSLVKLLLKGRYEDHNAMDMLRSCIHVFYKPDSMQKLKIIKLKDIHQMIISHSKFLEIIFDESGNFMFSKCSLIKLLACIIELCPGICNQSLVPVLMVAYQASLSECDQHLMKIFQLYEDNGVQMSQFQPLVWGQDAYDIYKSRKVEVTSLLQEQSSSQILARLDAKQMLRTTIQFPVNQNLKRTNTADIKDALYDPFFLLPLFASLLQPACQVDCRHFVESGCLSLTLASLSSHDINVRKLGYYVLSLFDDHVEFSRFREKSQIAYFLMLLKYSTTEEFMRFPSVWCVFFARYLYRLLRPDKHMYPILCNCILQKPAINVNELPVFLALFNSSSLEYCTERTWMLKLLADGLRDLTDFYLYKRYHVFELLMAFYRSRLSDKKSKVIILELIASALNFAPAAYDLVKTYSILSWIHAGLLKANEIERSSFLQLVDILMSRFHQNVGSEDELSVPRMLVHEAFVIYQSVRKQKSLVTESQLILLSIFSKLLDSPSHFCDFPSWIRNDEMSDALDLLHGVLSNGSSELLRKFEDAAVNLVNFSARKNDSSLHLRKWYWPITRLAKEKGLEELSSVTESVCQSCLSKL